MATLYYERPDYNTLQHHGIQGQKWGVKNGPPYPLDEKNHSAAEKKAESSTGKSKKSGLQLTEGQKKAIKYGLIATGVAVTAIGGVYLYKIGALNPLINSGRRLLETRFNGDSGFMVPGIKGTPLSPASKIYDALLGINPLGKSDNCKDVASVACCNYYGFDLVAGEKSFVGNLHEFIENKFGFENKVHTILPKTNDPKELNDKVSNYILKYFDEGDIGIINFDHTNERKNKVKEVLGKVIEEDGHTFNWIIENGKVTLACGQQRIPIKGDDFFNSIDISKEIEIVKITKEMAEIIAKHY